HHAIITLNYYVRRHYSIHCILYSHVQQRSLHSFPTRRSSDLNPSSTHNDACCVPYGAARQLSSLCPPVRHYSGFCCLENNDSRQETRTANISTSHATVPACTVPPENNISSPEIYAG